LPIYVYQCGDCLGEWKENHLMSESIEDCPWCDSKNIARKPSDFTFNSKKQEKQKKVGDLTREFIENSKEDLKNQKKGLDKNR
tara:strand:- start:9315 stop:9563 length:249 start_codon:yes stop_codon:yes gene_type:complete